MHRFASKENGQVVKSLEDYLGLQITTLSFTKDINISQEFLNETNLEKKINFLGHLKLSIIQKISSINVTAIMICVL